MDRKYQAFRRRTVLKGLGAGAVGSAAIAGGAYAGESRHGNQTEDHDRTSYTWANETLYEMLESEPPAIENLEAPPGAIDNEGNHDSHRPLWVVGSMADFSGADDLDGTFHSPHPNPAGFDIDHVVPVGGGGEFTAQWHVTLVVRPSSVDSDGNLIPDKVDFNNLPHGDGQGNVLISADIIRAAVDRGDRYAFPLFSPDGEPAVFTCPVRPHQHE